MGHHGHALRQKCDSSFMSSYLDFSHFFIQPENTLQCNLPKAIPGGRCRGFGPAQYCLDTQRSIFRDVEESNASFRTEPQ